MEEEHAKGPSHNNPEEAAEYVRSVTSLTDSFDTSIHGLTDTYVWMPGRLSYTACPASPQIGQRIFYQVGHRCHTRYHTRQSLQSFSCMP